MAFRGTRVFISRKYIAPDIIDPLRDALKANGAEICLCFNPSCNASTDFHVLPSFEHEKFEEFRSQGCNVIGPECIFRCAKERKAFPKQGYTCCLAMEGVKILATGFEKEEKVKIEQIVASMCGELCSRVSMDVTFVIAKNVSAAKYKWAVNNLRKPILTLDWLYQCWSEHRLLPCEPFRLPPFTGLTICVTNAPLDSRKEIEEIALKTGGAYSADLTKKCTHLIAYTPEGSKYRVAKQWGHVKIVNRSWFFKSIAAKACLDEDNFPVGTGIDEASRHLSASQGSLGKTDIATQLSGPPLFSANPEATRPLAPLSSAPSLISNTSMHEGACLAGNAIESNMSECSLHEEQSSHFVGHLDGPLRNDDDLYLLNCRIYFAGFSAVELRKLVNMVRDGGGTRHIEFNDRMTHIILGRPTESELKDIRQWTMGGAMYCVHSLWLEECSQQKREVAVSKRHLVPDQLLLGGTSYQEAFKSGNIPKPTSKVVPTSSQSPLFEESSALPQPVTKSLSLNLGENVSITERKDTATSFDNAIKFNGIPTAHMKDRVNGEIMVQQETMMASKTMKKATLELSFKHTSRVPAGLLAQAEKSRNVFNNHIFLFADSFPLDRREEIVSWIIFGSGVIDKDACAGRYESLKRKADFIIVSHGIIFDSAAYNNLKPVTSHWIRFCLEEGKMLDLHSHVLYQPLPCRIPLPGFENMRFCISQYEDRDRLLLRNLCYVLGAKFTEKLNKKVTHLLCKVRDGPKYEAANKWGIEVIVAEWLYSCVKQDNLIPLAAFRPLEPSEAEREAGLYAMTQCPSQAANLSSQWESDTQPPPHLHERNKAGRIMPHIEERSACEGQQQVSEKGLVEENDCNNLMSLGNSPAEECLAEQRNPPNNGIMVEDSDSPSDVAAAIEGLLAQTTKVNGGDILTEAHSVQDLLSPEHRAIKRIRDEQLVHLDFKRPKNWQKRELENMNESKTATLSEDQSEMLFDESQMESQVVGYEDHAERQLIMERVRTRSMSVNNVKVGREKRNWKNDGLGRLFKAAEANK